MSRRSTRLKSVPHPPVEDTLLGSDDDEVSEPVEEEPESLKKTTKRRKIAETVDSNEKKKHVRGRRGLLSSLKEFPLDVLFEIFGHLDPKDLLNLARTTKEIRGILMSRSTAFVWKEARTNAFLTFHGIFANRSTQILSSTTIATNALVLTLKPSYGVPEPACAKNFRDPLQLVSILHTFGYTGRRRWVKIRLYSIDFATKITEESKKWENKNDLQISDPGYLEWYKRNLEEMQQLNADGEMYTEWAATRSTNRSDELDEARRLRREAIVERLTLLGWGEEALLHGDFQWHKLVRQPKELTDRIWKNIKTPLIEFLTEKKKERLELQHHRTMRERHLLAGSAYGNWLKTFPPDAIFPPKIEVVTAEPFRAIIEITPIEEKLTEQSFAGALSQVPAFSDDWKRRKDEELLEIMEEHVPNSVEADLHLATTFFMCSGSPEPVGYPRILVHSRASSYKYNDRPGGIDPTIKLYFHEDCWNADRLIGFNTAAFRNARAVIEACGLDPDVTTAAEMDEIDPAIECLNCSNDSLGRLVMRWFQTATHFCHNPLQPNVTQMKTNWKCLKPDAELLVEVQEQETFERHDSYTQWRADFCCKFCDRHPTTFTSLQLHVKDTHNMDTLTVANVKYHIDVSAGNRHPRPLRLKPPVAEVVSVEAEVKDVEVKDSAQVVDAGQEIVA
ncbi:hypothetical protein DFH07DRAFT_959085 [Mycena maculata]|uniref:F-box domain-containing protein n=1 Tax=Mycena maculata TaxID=230809 RepID=A0AAD7J3X2_9AGAR|nr:hypothetical protein DFH07DRAFT_959085 [Mycena maculata]